MADLDGLEIPGVTPAALTQQLASFVAKSLYDANTILKADTDDTPAALTMGASTILARLAAGSIKAATPSEIITLLALTSAGITDFTEAVQDVVGALIAAGAGLTVSYNDAGNVETIASLGAVEVIAQTVLGSAAASIDFQSIPATYENLRVTLTGRGDTAATLALVSLRFNNDSGANYDSEYAYANGDTAGGVGDRAQTSGFVGLVAAATGTANEAGAVVVDIVGYARTVFRKSFVAQAMGKWGEAADTEMQRMAIGGVWRSTAAINRVTLLPGAGNFITGTVATLYGIKGS